MNDEKAPESSQITVAPPNKTEVKNVNYKKAPESTSLPVPPESLLSDKLLENHIRIMCKDHGMTIEYIRAGIQGSNDPDKCRKFHEVRDRIIKSLVSSDFGGLTQVAIGKILCASGATIALRMQKMGISPTNPREKHSKAFKTKKPKNITPVKPTKAKEKPENHLILNFSDHQETLEKIRKAAKDLMREPEAQVLFWLVHCDFEKLEGR